MKFRQFWLLVHRYTGLTMAAFLILVGLTGSLLAFQKEINHLVAPRFYAKPRPGVARLDFATLIDRAEALVPQGQVYWIISDPDQIVVRLTPRTNPVTGKRYALAVDNLYLNPWTGEELARTKPGERQPEALTNTILLLHQDLWLGVFGSWVLGIVALIWTIDCFIGLYLTLPGALQQFLRRWQVAWLVKWRASAFRINFDLHRASGLWFFLALLIFAWSSVMFNLPAIYERAIAAIFDYQFPPADAEMPMQATGKDRPPQLDFRTAFSTAQRLMAEQGAKHGFSVRTPTVFAYFFDSHTYFYNAKSSRDVWDSDHLSYTTLTFDGDTGALRTLHIPTGEHSGNTVTLWLQGLHEAWVFGLPYRIFVCVLGLVIAMLSYTGVYIWWKKRRVRIETARRQKTSLATAALQTDGGTV